MVSDRPKPHAFSIRGLQYMSVIERNFHVQSDKERCVPERWARRAGRRPAR